jgi:hypothetical protein
VSANVRSSNRSFGVQALSRINRSIGNKLATSVRMEIHRHELKYSLVLIDASAALKDLETRTLLEQQTMQILGSSPAALALTACQPRSR